MADAWAAKNELLDRGVPAEFALYLLPNAKAIRLVESGSLLHLLHKWTMRTCFNAQEEIYQASMEEVDQVRAALPNSGALHRSALLSCAPASPRPSAPKARTSAASRSGRSSPTSSGAYDFSRSHR